MPSLSIGYMPSVLAYAAMLNAVEEEFERIAREGDAEGRDQEGMEAENCNNKDTSPRLEGFQRDYRRYSRSQGVGPSRQQSASARSCSTSNDLESGKELFLEAWKEQFLTTVSHATDRFLLFSPYDARGSQSSSFAGADAVVVGGGRWDGLRVAQLRRPSRPWLLFCARRRVCGEEATGEGECRLAILSPADVVGPRAS